MPSTTEPIPADMDEFRDRKAQSALERVLALHERGDALGMDPWCSHDAQAWPCQTVRRIGSLASISSIAQSPTEVPKEASK